MFVAILTGLLYHMALPIQTLCSIICVANYYLPSALFDVNIIKPLTKNFSVIQFK